MLNLESFRPIYQAFLESGKTVCQFCADYPIHESRFYHWQAKLRQEAAKNQSGEFLPVSINNRGGKVVLTGGNGSQTHSFRPQQPTCEISFPNGVTVRINGNIPVEMLSGLIMLPR